MPVFPAHRCAFVHIPKTAGTALLGSLTAACGEAQYAGRGLWDMLAASEEREAALVSIRANFRLSTVRDFPQQHLPALALERLLGAQRWRALYTFAFVRNPWDLLVSTYHFNREHTARVASQGIDPDLAELHARVATFAQFVDLYSLMRSDMTAMLVGETGEPIIDFVGRYERLDEDAALIGERLGVRIRLERENVSARGAYREYYDRRTRAAVARHFARDIERFGYAF